MTEFIENNDPQAIKQDLELKAFYPMIDQLKQRFPYLDLWLLQYGLFVGGPTLERVEKYHWKYVLYEFLDPVQVFRLSTFFFLPPRWHYDSP